MTEQVDFDGEAFYRVLDAHRAELGLTWKDVALKSGVPASTLTRMSQGRRPDVDSLAKLVSWSGINADVFLRRTKVAASEAPRILTEMVAHLSADPNLSEASAKALSAVILATYDQLRER